MPDDQRVKHVRFLEVFHRRFHPTLTVNRTKIVIKYIIKNIEIYLLIYLHTSLVTRH